MKIDLLMPWVVRRYECGEGTIILGKKIGRNERTINYHLKKRGVQIRSASCRIPCEYDDMVINLYCKEMMSASQIAEELSRVTGNKLALTTVLSLLHRHNVVRTRANAQRINCLLNKDNYQRIISNAYKGGEAAKKSMIHRNPNRNSHLRKREVHNCAWHECNKEICHPQCRFKSCTQLFYCCHSHSVMHRIWLRRQQKEDHVCQWIECDNDISHKRNQPKYCCNSHAAKHRWWLRRQQRAADLSLFRPE